MRRLAWGLALVPFFVVSLSCGGTSGGPPAGLGGALVSKRLAGNIVALNVTSVGGHVLPPGLTEEDQGLQVPDGTLAAVGTNFFDAGHGISSFKIVLKGAGAQGGDASQSFDIVDDLDNVTHHTDAQQLYLVCHVGGPNTIFSGTQSSKNPNGLHKILVYAESGIGDASPTQVFDARTGVDRTAEADLTVGNFLRVKNGFRYISPNPLQFIQRGTYDVVVRFYSVPSGLQDAASNQVPNPNDSFYNILLTTKATIKDSDIFLSPPYGDQEGDDPSLNFSRGIGFSTHISNIPESARMVRVQVIESAIYAGSDSSSVTFEMPFYRPSPSEPIPSPLPVSFPIVNRLRKFTIHAQAFIDSTGETPAISTADDDNDGSGYDVPVQATSLDVKDEKLTSQVASIFANPLTLFFVSDPDGTDPTIGGQTFHCFATVFNSDQAISLPSDAIHFSNVPDNVQDISGVQDPNNIPEPNGTFKLLSSADAGTEYKIDMAFPVGDTTVTSVGPAGGAEIDVEQASTLQVLPFQVQSMPPRFGSGLFQGIEQRGNNQVANTPTVMTYANVLSALGTPAPVLASQQLYITPQVQDNGFKFKAHAELWSDDSGGGLKLATADSTAQSLSDFPSLGSGNPVVTISFDNLVTSVGPVTLNGSTLSGQSLERGKSYTVSVKATNSSATKTIDNSNFLFQMITPSADNVTVSSDGTITVPANADGGSSADLDAELLVAYQVSDSETEPGGGSLRWKHVAFKVKANKGTIGVTIK